MTLQKRRILYSFFILLFFILAPILISYSLGYRYNLTKGIIEKTGVIFIKSFPKNASIYKPPRMVFKN